MFTSICATTGTGYMKFEIKGALLHHVIIDASGVRGIKITISAVISVLTPILTFDL